MIDKPIGKPVGYTTRPVARRATRPLHKRRQDILEAAEAVFARRHPVAASLSRWPTPDAAVTDEHKTRLTEIVGKSPEVLDD